MKIRFQSTSVQETRNIAANLAAAVAPSTTIALNGTLGAGKTHFVQGFAGGLGIPQHTVVSPTFVLVQEYHGDKSIYHIDAYRIADEDEFLSLGVEEYFESAGIVIIEWAERVRGCLPPSYLEINILVTGETSRDLTFASRGTEFVELIEKLATADDSAIRE